jgi:hypothetical protein
MDPYAPQQSSAPVFGSPAPQVATSSFSSPSPQQTPSTLGFASPPYFASPTPQTSAVAPIPAVVPVAAQSFGGQEYAAHSGATESLQGPGFAAPKPVAEDPVFSMYNYNGQESHAHQQTTQPSGNLADQMYSKFVTMDTLDLVSKNEPAKGNPFDVYNTIGPQPSLADMKSMNKVRGFGLRSIS